VNVHLGSGWIHEIKHDGFQTLVRIAGKDVRAFSRSGLDWSDKYERVIDACRKLRCRSAPFDGEVVVQDEDGVSDFAALRAALERENTGWCSLPLTCYFLDGRDWPQEPLTERRGRLNGLISNDPTGGVIKNLHYCKTVRWLGHS
jgi:bifunctional non-homologous end joining protein LigD